MLETDDAKNMENQQNGVPNWSRNPSNGNSIQKLVFRGVCWSPGFHPPAPRDSPGTAPGQPRDSPGTTPGQPWDSSPGPSPGGNRGRAGKGLPFDNDNDNNVAPKRKIQQKT